MTALAKPKQARSMLKREQLIAAGELEFAQAGYVGATSKSIAQRAEVATGSFYQHFENKDALLREIAQRRMDFVESNLQGVGSGVIDPEQADVESILRGALMSIYAFHADAPELHQVLEERRHIDPQLAEILKDGEQILTTKVRSFVQSFNVAHPQVVASNLFAMAEGIVHRHVFEVHDFDAQAVIDQGAKMLAAFFEQALPK